jgi:hypothetical protein
MVTDPCSDHSEVWQTISHDPSDHDGTSFCCSSKDRQVIA